MASIEREVENALLNVVSGITGVNFFTSERGTARTMPSVTVQAQIGSEEIIPFSGVFKTPASITYVARADTTARADFDAKFYDILEQLYRDPDLASYLTDHSNLTFYVAKVTGDSPAVIGQNRTWSRAMTLDITATARKFLPSDISNLSVWFKADAGVTATGLNVTAWADQSGNGNNATAYNNPQLITNALNSKPVISFNGSTSYASFPISLAGNTPRTIFIVGKYNDINRQQEGFIALGFSGSWDRGYVFREAETENTYYYTPGQIAAPTSTSVANYHIATIKHFPLGSDDSTMGINGSFGTGGQIILSEINQGLIASRGVLDLEEYASVNIAEIIIYNKGLSLTELDQVQKYLNYKYAIY
jgi:hypothetical protein